MKTLIGWLKFNENKDEEEKKCAECGDAECTCDKESETDKTENEAFSQIIAGYDLLSIEEKKELPDFIKKNIEKGKKNKAKKGEKGEKPDFLKKKKK